ncbi:MAG: hypothetical protein Q7J05_02540 [Paludibacter sp.]|nr:hypothetical protein [Paludibacter sp.]
MKTSKIIVLITLCLATSNNINAQTIHDIKNYNVNSTWEDNSDESKLINLFNVEVISTYKSEDVYKNIPEMGTCWMITNWQEYNLICTNSQINNSEFNDYNFFIMTITSSGQELPIAKAGLYSDNYINNLLVFVKLQSTYRNMLFVIVTFWVPKKYCINLKDVSIIRKRINDPLPL